MKIEIQDLNDGIVILSLEGKLNMLNAPRLREVIKAKTAAGSTRIAIDLSRVDFIDSSGLGALINGLKTTRQAGGDLRISKPSEQVKLVLQLTNVERVLKIYDFADTAFL